jgi:hypothetical protein
MQDIIKINIAQIIDAKASQKNSLCSIIRYKPKDIQAKEKAIPTKNNLIFQY